MKFLISSHQKYYINTYPVIIQSLLDASINPKDIIMVVGGCSADTKLHNFLNINLIPVEYNSFDLTALIYVGDILDSIQNTHFFLMHDTCLVGSRFKDEVMKYDMQDLSKFLRLGISMNIGLYTKQLITSSKSILDASKFYPQTPEQIQKVKEYFVVHEDILFKQHPDHCSKTPYVTDGMNNLTLDELKARFPREPYISYFTLLQNSNIQREIGYGAELDFYKLQANTGWEGLWKIGI
jgi:hypothetical protein